MLQEPPCPRGVEGPQQTLSTAHGPGQGAGRTSVSALLGREVEGTVHGQFWDCSHSRERQERRGPERPLLRVKGRAGQGHQTETARTPQGLWGGQRREGPALPVSPCGD